MVDSRNFKNYGKNSGKKKKNPIIALVIIVVLALILVAIQWVMMDIISAVYK